MNRDFSKELGAAINFAAQYHINKFDKGGAPYILHPLAVMERVRSKGFGYMIVAICHDVFEDAFAGDLEQGFELFKVHVTSDVDIVTALRLLTHLPGITYMMYIRNLYYFPMAKDVKIADLQENSQISRLKGITEKDVARMKKYNAAYLYLTGQSDKLLGAFE